MTVRAIVRRSIRTALSLFTCVVLLAGAAPGIFAQASTAAVAGVILDPDGRPASGFKVILRDTASNKEFMSDPTDAEGNYSAQVPVGGRYKLVGVVADDGVTKLAVQDVPAVNVLTAGTTRLNVRFTLGPAPAAPPPADGKKKKDKGGAPWYKRPGPITGMVIGGVVVLALIAGGGGGGSDNSASPSIPPPDR